MINVATVEGNVGTDPEFKEFSGESCVLNLRIASTRKYREKEDTLWLDCSVWGNRARALKDLIRKGDHITVSGRLSLESWTASDGTKRSKVVLVIEEVSLPRRPHDSAPDARPETPTPPPKAQRDFNDDIPF